MEKFGIVVHGGAGTILKSRMTQEKEDAYKAGLEDALDLGYKALADGKSAMDAAEIAVISLEDNPLFNAGKGAVFAGDGSHLLDASVMRGDNLEAGSIACVKGVRNPVKLARLVMEDSPYVMMVAEGAENFARLKKLPFESPEYFFDALRYEQWTQIKDTPVTQLDHADKGEKNYSTVGAVALDQNGNLAAATSTGGMTNKRYGRVGDTPIIGAGIYAHNDTCAVCCTGHGEPFIRAAVAHDISSLIAYKNYSLEQACHHVVYEKLVAFKAKGGLIAIDRQGNIQMPFNCEGMYRGSWIKGSSKEIFIYKS